MRSFAIDGVGSVSEIINCAKNAEACGFDKFAIPDESPSPPFRDPFVCLTAVALNTKKISIESMIIPLFTRHVAHVAVFASSLDEIAPGRFALGLGPGGSLTLRPLMMRMWDRPLTRVRESVAILRRLFAGETVSFDGETVKIQGVRLADPPHHAIPIYLAARGPRMLELAGEIADGVLLNPPLMTTSDALKDVEHGANKAGRGLANLHKSASVWVVISKDEKKAKDQARHSLVGIMGDVPEVVRKKTGISLEMIESIRNLISRGRFEEAASLVSDDLVDVYGVAGTLDYCTEKLAEYFRAGLDEVDIVGPQSAKDRMTQIRLIGREIIPRLREQ